ncbi:integrase/recombinase, phage integrase family [Treponema primitia ZAS-2]|uniref:Integrase/recombinase, phage integrase family n=1 Tax=Treponema primitia (strain ATCC BAA-887 / DSM 12427 / ZAS-2) TaxID=545694 RepID=F5YIS5_TREPZ|nr:site-specific tyrosine recombinase/integron integrase [Treponema primitia]AEF85075.1 integrase/recombinase, phage integrase family [Treponema primitia ZAS-2]
MKEALIIEIEQGMITVLDNAQMEHLHKVLIHCLYNVTVTKNTGNPVQEEQPNEVMLDSFLASKRVEGCSEKSLKYYRSTIQNMLNSASKTVKHMTTDDLRQYLADYQNKNRAGKVTLDNIRRILSSFFSWLEDENHILKSPVRRIHKIKAGQTVKETYSDEALESMRDNCASIRDLAIIDLLASTGMRVGEMVKLNRNDIDFANRECVVLGKGEKERPVYFDARAKIHLQNYLNSRPDDNSALFVSLIKPFNRLEISGVEIRLRELGKQLNIPKVHPHKFRRTLATRAIDKGMPIEQVQQLLGHQKIDTTLQYAMVSQNNVKLSHRKYIG